MRYDALTRAIYLQYQLALRPDARGGARARARRADGARARRSRAAGGGASSRSGAGHRAAGAPAPARPLALACARLLRGCRRRLPRRARGGARATGSRAGSTGPSCPGARRSTRCRRPRSRPPPPRSPRCRSRCSRRATRRAGRASSSGSRSRATRCPGIVIALSLVFFAANYASPLYQTLALLVFAYVVRFLPQALAGVESALASVGPRDRGGGAGARPRARRDRADRDGAADPLRDLRRRRRSSSSRR